MVCCLGHSRKDFNLLWMFMHLLCAFKGVKSFPFPFSPLPHLLSPYLCPLIPVLPSSALPLHAPSPLPSLPLCLYIFLVSPALPYFSILSYFTIFLFLMTPALCPLLIISHISSVSHQLLFILPLHSIQFFLSPF